MTDSSAPRLPTAGTIYVTIAAATTAAEVWRCGVEEARRRLCVLLHDAHQVDPAPPEQWRAKRRSTGWDVTARVSREPPLAVVVSCAVRPLPRGDARLNLDEDARDAGVTVERIEPGWVVRQHGEELGRPTTRAGVRELQRDAVERARRAR
jgi:hypothetical protein